MTGPVERVLNPLQTKGGGEREFGVRRLRVLAPVWLLGCLAVVVGQFPFLVDVAAASNRAGGVFGAFRFGERGPGPEV